MKTSSIPFRAGQNPEETIRSVKSRRDAAVTSWEQVQKQIQLMAIEFVKIVEERLWLQVVVEV